jgi:hypothetical protein
MRIILILSLLISIEAQANNTLMEVKSSAPPECTNSLDTYYEITKDSMKKLTLKKDWYSLQQLLALRKELIQDGAINSQKHLDKSLVLLLIGLLANLDKSDFYINKFQEYKNEFDINPLLVEEGELTSLEQRLKMFGVSI